ncbi:phasin family protein [Tropicimonas sp. TH_r6]|uniref:phasin family protein n=1 Tax=Tropicimonas sp. TH_r6 TaxID=3082085 RepID=UPI002954218A|nr:phasin family protein [Tropicimonas sp. TH_r6]MDV7143925.1 phasin family protein [Tropicimonas sp. TH_r6]
MNDAGQAAEAARERMTSLFEDWQAAGLGAWSWANPVWFRQIATINAEVTRFVTDRLRQDVEFQTELMQCRDPAEMQEVQGRFLKNAFDQYSAETGKLVQMNRDAYDAVTGRTGS